MVALDDGNITQEGIRKDMEWMSASASGHARIFDANHHDPSDSR